MRRVGFGVAVVVLLGLLARQSAARQPCRGQPLNLELKLQEVRVDGVSVDGGFPGATESASVFPLVESGELLQMPPPGCEAPVVQQLALDVTDPFTNESTFSLTFEAQP